LRCIFYIYVDNQAFAPRVTFMRHLASSPIVNVESNSATTVLFACRTNAKKEKIKRNRENMRKFKTGGGKKGISRRKLMKKALSSTARQEEAEFIAKCYLTVPAPSTGSDDSNSQGRGRKY
jgi:hypothetical protein